MTVKELKNQLNELRGCDEMDVVFVLCNINAKELYFTIEVVGTNLQFKIDSPFLESVKEDIYSLHRLFEDAL